MSEEQIDNIHELRSENPEMYSRGTLASKVWENLFGLVASLKSSKGKKRYEEASHMERATSAGNGYPKKAANLGSSG
ncbi:hypothetical protein BDZ89DRAFT_1073778 [Hymenopellis radicata]|nr:hypothetical protein BDZ89DRAFT_1073778 [Hymenopellis radicata]